MQAGVIDRASENLVRGEEFFEVPGRSRAKLTKSEFGQQNRVPQAAVPRRLANRFGMARGKIEEGAQRLIFEVGLVSEQDDPMREVRAPTLPSGGGLNGTEHAALRHRVVEAVLRWKVETIQLSRHG